MHSSATACSALVLTVGRISFTLFLTPPSTHRLDSCSLPAMVADSSSATRTRPRRLLRTLSEKGTEYASFFWGLGDGSRQLLPAASR